MTNSLFEQYGARVATLAETPPTDVEGGLVGIQPEEGEDIGEADPGHIESYAVHAFELARDYLSLVDNWVEQVGRTAKLAAGDIERQVLRRDGELLIQAFGRQSMKDAKIGQTRAIGARIAAEELSQRLQQFPEA
ncbi:MAG: hypothetical protein IPP47_06925 [Bryobacterales bacterium]|nr:hypothetical protein [Bryobacterales bacterium]